MGMPLEGTLTQFVVTTVPADENAMRVTTASVALSTLLIFAGCSNCSSDEDQTLDPEETEPIEWPTPTTGPAPCTPSDADGATVALEREFRLDTFLWPDAGAEEIAVDYDVMPRAATQRITVRDERDSTAEAEVFEEACPRTLPLSALGPDGIRVARVQADDGNGGDVRSGRVFHPTGPHTIDVELPALEGTGWTLLVEPAAGATRLAMKPLSDDELAAGAASISGVLDQASTVAVVRDENLLVDADARVTWAPSDWASTWRGSAARWYGGMRFAGDTEPVRLEARRTDDGASKTLHVGPRQTIALQDHPDTETLLLLGLALDLEVDLSFDCSDAPRLSVASFAEVTLVPEDEEAEPQILAPGEALDFAGEECQPDAQLRVVSLNQHNPILIVTRGER